jgi:hypothetical protein
MFSTFGILNEQGYVLLNNLSKIVPDTEQVKSIV